MAHGSRRGISCAVRGGDMQAYWAGKVAVRNHPPVSLAGSIALCQPAVRERMVPGVPVWIGSLWQPLGLLWQPADGEVES